MNFFSSLDFCCCCSINFDRVEKKNQYLCCVVQILCSPCVLRGVTRDFVFIFVETRKTRDMTFVGVVKYEEEIC